MALGVADAAFGSDCSHAELCTDYHRLAHRLHLKDDTQWIHHCIWNRARLC